MTGRAIAWAAGGLVALVLVVVGSYYLIYKTASVRGKVAANEQIYSGSNRIIQYDAFYKDCAQVQTDEAAITQLQKQLKSETDPQDRSNTQTNISANVIDRADAVNSYNARSDNGYEYAQFRAHNLPRHLPIQIPEGGTQCATS